MRFCRGVPRANGPISSHSRLRVSSIGHPESFKFPISPSFRKSGSLAPLHLAFPFTPPDVAPTSLILHAHPSPTIRLLPIQRTVRIRTAWAGLRKQSQPRRTRGWKTEDENHPTAGLDLTVPTSERSDFLAVRNSSHCTQRAVGHSA